MDEETKAAIAQAAGVVLTPENLAAAADMAERMTRFADVLSRVKMSAERKVVVTFEPHECESLIWGMQVLRKGPDPT